MTRVLFTDGSASPNPGPGGFAVIEKGKPVVLGSEQGETTNIRMEGFAIRAALELVAGEKCEIHSDSEFWINVLTKASRKASCTGVSSIRWPSFN